MPSNQSIPHGQQRPDVATRHANGSQRLRNAPDVLIDGDEAERIDFMEHPANVDAEYGIIGAIYLDNEMFAEISERIQSSADFTDSHTRVIYAAMQALYERGEPIEYITVKEELQRTDQLENAGGEANATSGRYTDICVLSWRGIAYADIVSAHARKREILDAQRRIVAKVFAPDVSASQALAAISAEIQPLADKLAENQRLDGGIISAAELMRMEIPEMNWPIASILPEGLAIIGAPPKTGKSAIALQLALSIALGGRALGNAPAAQGDVLYLALEDSPARMKERIERQMCGETVPDNLSIMFSAAPMLEGGLIQIESWLRGHVAAQAVFIDTIGRFRGVGSQTENGNIFAADYQDMAKLQSLALKHHVAIVVLHHLTKNRAGTDAIESLSGTTGISAAADVVWILSRERNQEAGELQIMGRDVMEQNIAVTLSQLTLTWQAVGAAEDVALKEGQRRVFEALKALAAPSTPSDIAAHTGEKLGAVKMRCVRMKGDGLLLTPKPGRYWFSRQRPAGF